MNNQKKPLKMDGQKVGIGKLGTMVTWKEILNQE
jgi:hypothetical protein